MTMLT
jgi:hypothetical protein